MFISSRSFMRSVLALVAVCASAGHLKAVPIYGLTSDNGLVVFDATTPGNVTNIGAISGLGAGEFIIGIDFRPLTNQLFGIGSGNNIYVINTANASASLVSNSPNPFTLNGTAFGVDFNPSVDRIRLMSDAEQNLRLNPLTGGLAGTDSAINPAGNIVGAAYTNNFPGVATTSTTLYGIDSVSGQLVTVGGINSTPSPNLGQVFNIGALFNDGTTFNNQVGFDIGQNGIAYASLNLTGQNQTQLYTINLSTGGATLVGSLGGSTITDIAVQTTPEPSSLLLSGVALGIVAVLARRRKR